MDLTKKDLPEAVEVSGKFYKIHTGHSYWFRFSQLLSSAKYLEEFSHLYQFEVPEDLQLGLDQLLLFYYEPKPVPVASDGGERVLDYDLDSDFIYSALLQCYGVDLMAEQIHWHKVRAMIAGVTGTRLNDIIGYRSYTGKDKEYQRLKRMWALPARERPREEQEADERRYYNAQF